MMEICAVLSQRGHVLDLFELADQEREVFSIRDSVRSVYEFTTPDFVSANRNIITKTLGDLRFYSQLRAVYGSMAKQINEGDYDVAFVHHCRFTQSPFVLSALRIPSVYYCQEPPRTLYEPSIPRSYLPKTGRLRGLLRARKLNRLRHWDRENTLRATVVCVNSYYSGESFYRTYGRNALIARLGVDADRFAASGGSRDDIVVSVGSFTPNKGHDLAVEALARIPERRRPRLVITTPSAARGSEEEEYIRRLAKAYTVQLDVITLGTDQEIAELFSRAACNVFLPRLEPFGFVPLEAMAAGTPTVGVAEGGVRETVTDGVTGILCERDADQVAEAIDRLLTDEKLRTRLAAAGLEDVRNRWQWSHSVDAVERAFEKALAARPLG
jgi:glycosyltransferase involved in cell wall biosynthesis